MLSVWTCAFLLFAMDTFFIAQIQGKEKGNALILPGLAQ